MKRKDKRKYRLVTDFNDQSVARVTFKQRGVDGTYESVDRPWGLKELAGLKLAAKVATMLSRGVANFEEVRRTATRRRKRIKKPPIEGASVLKTSTARHNGRDNEAWT